MIKSLDEMEIRFDELEKLLQDPNIMKNGPLYAKYLKEHGTLSRPIPKYRELKKVRREHKDAQEMIEEENDQDLKEMAKEELKELEGNEKKLLQEIQEILVTEDETGQRNVIVEIRAGTGGDEACLFASELYLMYQKYADKKHWRLEVLENKNTGLGGIKELTFSLKGKQVYKHMKYESGGHRVQRIPVTESGGRIHTSACTVAVLPEAEEVEVEINPKDLKTEAMRASGPGGQNVNKTSSAIRITHIPTGIVVSCQETPEQHKNKMKAMRILRARLRQQMEEEQHAERNQLRKSQHGSGDRNERIRTYNFPQNRVTDHRVNHSIYNLENVLLGEIEDFVIKLQADEKEKRLQELGANFLS